MKLYYGLTNYHLLCSILHKLVYFPDEKAIFVASEGRTKDRIEILRKLKIFDEVYYIEDKKLRNESLNDTLTEQSSDLEIENIAREYVCKYEKVLPFDMKKMDDFYIFADHGAFGLYLLIKKQKFIYIEDARGIYSKWKDLARIIKAKDLGMHIMSVYYKAYGRSDLITQNYVAYDSQLEGCDFNNCVDFDVNVLLDKLDSEQLNEVFEVFKFKKYETKSEQKNALILTQRFSTFKLLTR